MDFLLGWINEHGFTALQSVGILGGLFYTGYSLRLDGRIRRAQTLVKITEEHRMIWLQLLDHPTLSRIVDPKIDLGNRGPTANEILFVNLVILHLSSVMVAIRQGTLTKPAGLDEDVREFFLLPIPSAVWNQTRNLRDPEIIEFVERIRKKATLPKANFWNAGP